MNWVKTGISAFIGFLIAIIVAICIERFGGTIGGIISSVPTTVVPTSYILLTDPSKDAFTQAEDLCMSPIGIFSTNLFFLPTWKYLPQKLDKYMGNTSIVWVTLVLSLIAWFIAAFAMTSLQSFTHSLGVQVRQFSCYVMGVCVVLGVMLCWSLPPSPKGTKRVKPLIHFLRGCSCSLCIIASGLMSSSGYGAFAGAFSGFPAIFSTSIVSVSLAQGASVSAGAIGPMILGGCAGGFYALLCSQLYFVFHFAPLVAIVVAYVLVVSCWNVPVFFFIRWRRDKTSLQKVKQIPQVSTNEEPNKSPVKVMDEFK